MPKGIENTSSPVHENESPELQALRRKWRKQTGHDNWYDWCLANWGCKWDVSMCSCTDEGDFITYYFETPWGPPEAAINKLREMFPDLLFSLFYREDGMQLTGWL